MAGTFKCERGDCPQETNKDCSLCDRPIVTRNVGAVLRLYKQCREWKVLPVKGSLMEQPAVLMDLLDTVNERVLFWKQKNTEEERANLMKEKMLSKM